jgi:uncharacterized membrane protein YeaQ/YmgE (transglycosylase-associated protein family)
MGIISWLVMGLIVGALAKWIMPGKDSSSIIGTIVVGIIGAILGGWIGSLLGLGGVDGFNLGSIAVATGGALLLLYLLRKFGN